MTAPTLDGNSLGKVDNIQVEKSEDVMNVSPPTQDSDETVLAELTGALKTINVKGKLTATSISALKIAIDTLEDNINGNQATTVEFVSDVTGTINVMVSSFTWIYSIETRVTVDYSLTLIEGTV